MNKQKGTDVQSKKKSCNVSTSSCKKNYRYVHASNANISYQTNKPADDLSDSDDFFGDIQSCKNINFSRTTSYLCDELQFSPPTPRSHVAEKENILPNSTNISSIDKSLPITAFDKHPSSRKSKTALQTNNKLNSTPKTPKSLLLTPCSLNKSRVSSTPISKATPPNQFISSFKSYSLMKAAIEAKKDFENILKAAKIRRSLKSKNGINGGFDSPQQDHNKLTPAHKSKNGSEINSSLIESSIQTPLRPISSKVDKLESCGRSPWIVSPSSNVETTPVMANFQIVSAVNLKSTLSTPNINNSLLVDNNANTPLATVEKAISTPCSSGVKHLGARTRMSVPNIKSVNKKCLNSRPKINEEDDDDLPCTQPISSIILRGVVAYVEIRSGKEYCNLGTAAELESLGAKVEKNFTRKVTHCFFHGGKMSTFRRAVEWKIPLVSTLWIEACKADLRMVPLEGHKPHGIEKYYEDLPLYKLKHKFRRPVTDSKIISKTRKQPVTRDKTTDMVEPRQLTRPGIAGETDKLIDALHSVAGDLRKATNQFEKILTSPVLQKNNKQLTKNDSENQNSDEIFVSKKKRNKKLVFVSSSEDECNKATNVAAEEAVDSSSVVNDTNDSQIRISYDSDDLYAYAKKLALNTRCSAPARMLTSRKCKKLLTSCQKQQTSQEKGNDNVDSRGNGSEDTNKKSKTKPTKDKNTQSSKRSQGGDNVEKPTTRKRKLILPTQMISTFEQDSAESAPDSSPLCPYAESPKKKLKTAVPPKNKTIKPLTVPPVFSDCESDDSLTRAARRESSALFVKKEKKENPQRYVPTIVCTSLPRTDVGVVHSIVSRLGKFAMEGTVNERTTHVVTCTPRRTVNLLKGIARGCWILNIKWVYESLEVGKWLPEERYELIEFSPSVQQARVERQAFGPEFSLELFKGVGAIYVCRATAPPAPDLTELIRVCGGTVVSSARAAKIIIGSTLPFSPTGKRPLMVKEKWVLDSITKLSQLSPYDYITVDSEP